MSRPPLVLVTGTGTDVGKTWVTGRLVARLRHRGARVAARKPAQSFDASDPPEGLDAVVLAMASDEDPAAVCPPHRSYAVLMAPPMAAESLGLPPFSVADLVGELDRSWTSGASGVLPEVALVETAGGVRSPQAVDGDVVDLWRALTPCLVVLVADAGLGAIHAVRSSAAPFLRVVEPADPRPGAGTSELVVVLNRFRPSSELHRRNRAWLAERDRLEVTCVPGEEEVLAERVLDACDLNPGRATRALRRRPTNRPG